MSDSFDPFDPRRWVELPGCDAFEIALEMHRSRALAPGSVAILESHLAGCAACQRYAATLGALAPALALTDVSAGSVDWPRLRARIDGSLSRSRHMAWVLAGGMMASTIAIPVADRLFGVATSWVTRAAALADLALLLAVMIARTFRWKHPARWSILGGADTVAAYRIELTRRLRGLRLAGPLLAVTITGSALATLGSYLTLMDGNARSGSTFIFGAFMTSASLVALIIRRRAANDLRGELASLR